MNGSTKKHERERQKGREKGQNERTKDLKEIARETY